MVAFLTRAPAGFPGSVSRSDSLTIQQEIPDGTLPPTKYGQAVKMVANKILPLAASDAAALVYGLLVRPYPMQSTTNGIGASAPPVTGILDVMKRGYMTVTLAVGTAVKGGAVYVVNVAGGTVVVGDYVTSASPAGGGTAVAVPNAFFMGPADAGGITEIAYNI